MNEWQIAEEAVKRMKTIFQIAKETGIEGDELISMNHHIGKVAFIQAFSA